MRWVGGEGLICELPWIRAKGGVCEVGEGGGGRGRGLYVSHPGSEQKGVSVRGGAYVHKYVRVCVCMLMHM